MSTAKDSRVLRAELERLTRELLRGEEPMPADLSALQQELWQAARAERLAEESRLELKAEWEKAIRARFFPNVPPEWDWYFPWIWMEEILIPWAAREGRNAEELVADPGFADSLDLALLSRFLSEDQAREILIAEDGGKWREAELPRFSGEWHPYDDEEHAFRHLCALALLLNAAARREILSFLTYGDFDAAYDTLLAASDLCAFDPARTELRGWFRGGAAALEFERRSGA